MLISGVHGGQPRGDGKRRCDLPPFAATGMLGHHAPARTRWSYCGDLSISNHQPRRLEYRWSNESGLGGVVKARYGYRLLRDCARDRNIVYSNRSLAQNAGYCRWATGGFSGGDYVERLLHPDDVESHVDSIGTCAGAFPRQDQESACGWRNGCSWHWVSSLRSSA